jgi:hypothetical protein
MQKITELDTGRLIYVAGPFSTGDTLANIDKAIKAGNELLDAGFFPFVPHTTFLMHMQKPREYRFWMNYCMVWLDECDAVYRLQGESPGADEEVAAAKGLMIPVFHSIDAIKAWFKV